MESLKDMMKREAEEVGAGGSSDFFRFEESGDYRFRILIKPEALATHFFGKGSKPAICYGVEKGCPFHGAGAPKDEKTGNEKKPSVKFQAYLLDREDGAVKLGELPWSVLSVVSDFQEDADYKFESYPMPYDIKVKVDKENKDPKAIYKTMAAPTRDELTAEQLKTVEEKMAKLTPADFVAKRKDKQLEAHKADGIFNKEQERREQLRKDIEEAKNNQVKEDGEAIQDNNEPNPNDIPF